MIYVIYGHSGSGKTTLVNNLSSRGILPNVETFTDRPKRSPDEGGYVFLSTPEFLKVEAMGGLVGVRYFETIYGNKKRVYRYGISLETLKPFANDSNHCTIVTDAKGVDELFEYFGSENVVAVYMYGNKELLRSRMKGRNDFDSNEWERRYNADNATLSLDEFAREAAGDKFITGYRYFKVESSLDPESQINYFTEVILNG